MAQVMSSILLVLSGISSSHLLFEGENAGSAAVAPVTPSTPVRDDRSAVASLMQGLRFQSPTTPNTIEMSAEMSEIGRLSRIIQEVFFFFTF
jgi:hypothetical protein